MPVLDFTLEEFEQRQRRVREAMQAEGIDLLLAFHPVSIAYLTGCRSKSYQEFQVLFFPAEEGPLTIQTRLAEVAEIQDFTLAEDVRGWGGREPEDPVEVFASIMREKNYLGRRIGMEVPNFYMHPSIHKQLVDLLGSALVFDASKLVHDLKLVKSPAELAYVREASRIADAALDTVQASIKDGATECEVAGEAYRTLLSLGSDVPASPMNFVSGDRTCYSHGQPTVKPIRTGEFMHVEFGAAVKRYCATVARHFNLGEPSARAQELHDIIRASCDACISEIRAGVAAVKPHEAAKQVIAEAGLDQYRLHTTGYGIAPGYPPSWGEGIHLFADSTYTLEAGMLLSVEPPIFIREEQIGVRLIDNVIVTETGAEIISSFSRDLVVV